MRARLLVLLVLLVLGSMALAGCSGASEGAASSASAGGAASDADSGADSSSADSSSAEAPAAAPAASGVASADKADTGSASASGSSSPSDVTNALTRRVRTADVSLEVTDLAGSAAKVRTLATSLGGVVSTEQTSFDPVPAGDSDLSSLAVPSGGSSALTVRVPEPKLDSALDRLSEVGRELSRSTSSEDVTAAIADLDSRVATQTQSVARVRALMSKAQKLSDVVLLEGELARRESDLEAVQARQRVLSDQADFATINVSLRTADSSSAVTTSDDAGFLGGLTQGWHAVQASTRVVLTVIGAVLPVGLALVILGYPSWLVYRRFTRRPAVEPVPESVPQEPVSV